MPKNEHKEQCVKDLKSAGFTRKQAEVMLTMLVEATRAMKEYTDYKLAKTKSYVQTHRISHGGQKEEATETEDSTDTEMQG